jgi:hypothetical protein
LTIEANLDQIGLSSNFYLNATILLGIIATILEWPIPTLSPNMSPMDLLGVENGPNRLFRSLHNLGLSNCKMFSNFCRLFTSLQSHDLVFFLHSLLISTRRRCKKYITKVCKNQHYHRCNFLFLFCKFSQLGKIKKKLQRVQRVFFHKKTWI